MSSRRGLTLVWIRQNPQLLLFLVYNTLNLQMKLPRPIPSLSLILVVLVSSLAGFGVARKPKPKPKPAVAKETVNLSNVDNLVQDLVSDGGITGAVLLVGHDGQVIHQKAFGRRATIPRSESMTTDTVFDLAS